MKSQPPSPLWFSLYDTKEYTGQDPPLFEEQIIESLKEIKQLKESTDIIYQSY